jgi:hypothetical protein
MSGVNVHGVLQSTDVHRFLCHLRVVDGCIGDDVMSASLVCASTVVTNMCLLGV